MKVRTKKWTGKFLEKKCISRTFSAISLTNHDDFPKIDVQLIKSKITFGWYQIEQGFGYLAEHFDQEGDIEIRSDKDHYDKDNNTKVIGTIFFSRHSNSKTYEVFIKYRPSVNCVDGIVGWICSCLSGHRTCGTCSHITAFIYFLSYGNYQNEPFKHPGSTLSGLFCNRKTETVDEDTEITETLIFL